MGNKNNRYATAAQFQEPWQNQFPIVGIIFLYAGKQARKIIQKNHFNFVRDGVLEQRFLHRRRSEV